jgi:hypothetical protein
MALANTPIANGSFLQIVPPAPGFGGLPTESFATLGVGTFTLNGTTAVTVADAGTNLTSMILFSLNTVGGTVGAIPSVKTITAGTGFTVSGTASDTSVYNFLRIG